MRPRLLFLLAFFATAGAPILSGQSAIATERKVQILREAKAGYEGAQTYHDRGVVRILRLKGDFSAPGTTSSPEIVEERNIVFETAYRADGNLRVLIAAFDGTRPQNRSFLRISGSVSVRSSGVSESSQLGGSFFDRIEEAFSSQLIDGNEIPRLLAAREGFHRPTVFPPNPSVEEAVFNGVPVYQVSGGHALDFATLWMERNTLLIIGVERVRSVGSNDLLVIRTLYKPKRNLALSSSHFDDIGAEDLIYDPAEWQFPGLNATELMEKVRRIPPGRTASTPPPGLASNRPDQNLPPPMRRQPAPSAPEPPSAAPSSPEPPANTPDAPETPAQETTPPPALKQHLSTEDMGSIVLIEGDTGQGTGFICRIKDLSFVVTNLHVLADTKTLRIRDSRGKIIQARDIHAARGYDVALIRIDEVNTGLKMAPDAAESQIGDEVVVVGNRLGGGVLTQETGQVLGIGPDRLEVNAKFQPGNSGSPIVNTRTGEVIGVATYLQTVSMIGDGRATTDDSDKPSRELSTRWFGYRFDSIREWERVDWAEWQRQGLQIQKFRENSDVILGLLQGERSVYMANQTIRGIVERYERSVNIARMSQTERARANRRLVKDLINFCRNDLNTLDGKFYDYFRSSDYFETSIPLQREFRQMLTDYLEERERDFLQIAIR